jgi:hypothetical protein
MALSLKDEGPAIIAVNSRSMLGSNMVKEAYGVAGGDLRIAAEILARAALSDGFAAASGQYFDNDIGQFVSPIPMHSILKNVKRMFVLLRRFWMK